MKITIAKDEPKLTMTNTRDIPVGQVFGGAVWGSNCQRWVHGVFYKAQGRWHSQAGSGHDMVLVHLDVAGSQVYSGTRYANLFVKDTDVLGYEPLEAEVVARRA